MSFLSFRLCHLLVFLQYHPQSQYAKIFSLANDLKCFLHFDESNYFTCNIGIMCKSLTVSHSKCTSVWSLEGGPRNSHDFLITYINHGCQQRPHPFLSKQPIPSCFFSAGRSQISREHLLKTAAVRIFSYTHPDSKCVQQDPGLYIHSIVTQCVSNYSSSYVLCRLLSYKINQPI